MARSMTEAAPLGQVLIIGLNYAPEPVGIGPYTQGLAQALSENGAKVEAVVANPYYPHWQTLPLVWWLEN